MPHCILVIAAHRSNSMMPSTIASKSLCITDICKTSANLLSLSVGGNVGSGPNHHDAALVADFENIDSFRRYIAGDKHKAYVEDHARHVVAKLAAIQHEM